MARPRKRVHSDEKISSMTHRQAQYALKNHQQGIRLISRGDEAAIRAHIEKNVKKNIPMTKASRKANDQASHEKIMRKIFKKKPASDENDKATIDLIKSTEDRMRNMKPVKWSPPKPKSEAKPSAPAQSQEKPAKATKRNNGLNPRIHKQMHKLQTMAFDKIVDHVTAGHLPMHERETAERVIQHLKGAHKRESIASQNDTAFHDEEHPFHARTRQMAMKEHGRRAGIVDTMERAYLGKKKPQNSHSSLIKPNRLTKAKRAVKRFLGFGESVEIGTDEMREKYAAMTPGQEELAHSRKIVDVIKKVTEDNITERRRWTKNLPLNAEKPHLVPIRKPKHRLKKTRSTVIKANQELAN